jgi:perosamine synthetase
MNVPVNTPLIDDQDIQAVLDCVKSGWISSQGPYIESFERSFADLMNCRHAISVANGSAALDIAIEALKLPKCSEVIIPNFTIFSPAISVIRAGLVPVFIDVNIETCNAEVENILSAVNENTSAIILVHTYGLTTDTEELIYRLKDSGIKIIEDCAEAHGIRTKSGKRVGLLADVATFSFYPNKLITTGEGGMVITNEDSLVQNIRELRNIGFSEDLPRYQHTWLGYNYRMTSMQAALGSSQLKKIEDHLVMKYAIGEKYNEAFQHLHTKRIFLPPVELNGSKNSYWIYGIRFFNESEKLDFQRYLNDNKIGNRDYFFPLHLQPALEKFDYRIHGDLENSIELSKTGIYIPSGLGITDQQQEYVIYKIQNYFK